jgi:hypothetical protein
MPGEDSCPFEPKASDWGWFEGRMVALDCSAYRNIVWKSPNGPSFMAPSPQIRVII